jgi:ATP-dependent DNA helicase RecG
MVSESLVVEYKREYVEDIKKTVVAFANTNGGKIYIGVDDDGTVLGIENIDLVIQKVTNAIRDSIKPDVTIYTRCESIVRDNKEIVVVTIQKGTASPYYLSNKGLRPEGVYVRQGTSSVPASTTAIRQMIKETDGDDFENTRSLEQGLTFQAMEREFADAGVRLGKEQMRTLGLIDSDGLYTNLALVLSDQCPFTIKVGVFQGTDVMVFKHRHEFGDSLFTQMHDVYECCNRYNQTRSEFSGLKRIDSRDYPESAIRESLINILVHRDYTVRDSAIISVFDDRMEFTNFGSLLAGIQQEDIYAGISKLRNHNLAQVFYRLQLIEAYGTGVPRIMKSYENVQVTPCFTVTPNVFKVILPSRNYRREQESRLEETMRPYGITAPSDLFFTPGEEKVLQLFKQRHTIRRKDIEAALKISQPMAIKLLHQLLTKKAIIKHGAGKNSCYVIAK